MVRTHYWAHGQFCELTKIERNTVAPHPLPLVPSSETYQCIRPMWYKAPGHDTERFPIPPSTGCRTSGRCPAHSLYIHNLTRNRRMGIIQDFSTELLCFIFQIVQARDQRPHPSASLRCYRSRFHSLTLLSLVCKSWREAILEYGVLWASIPVDTSRPGYLESASTMLKRSNGAELELSVLLSVDFDGLDHTRSIVRTFTHQGARIRSLHLSADSHRVPKRAPQLPKTTAKVIASIGEFTLPERHPISQYPTNPFRGLSSLSLSLPSSVVAVNLSVILDTIKSFPELEYLRLASFLPVIEDCPPTSSVEMPNLLRFSLRRCDSAIILSHVITPKTSFIDVVMNPRRTRILPTHTHILAAFPHLLTNIRALEETTKLILEEDERSGGFSLSLSLLCAHELHL